MDHLSGGDTAMHSSSSTISECRSESIRLSGIGLGIPTGGNDITKNATILEEGLRVCPMCQSELRLLMLNLEEKIRLCENLECEYPFCEDNIPIYKTGSEICSISKYSRSKLISDDASATCSIASSSWSDVERITKALDPEYTASEYRLKMRKKNIADQEKVQKLLKNIDHVKNLTNQMKEINGIGRVKRITNNAYIKNLANLQAVTGVQFLKPEELKVVERHSDNHQVKVNVNTDPENSVSCIRIELVDTNEENKSAGEASSSDT